MGTRTVMESKLYGGVSSAELIAPEGKALDEVHAAYSGMATVGKVTDPQREVFFRVGRQLSRERGCEAVMLGGTDLFLAFVGHPPEFALVDCADIHVDAIYAKSSALARHALNCAPFRLVAFVLACAAQGRRGQESSLDWKKESSRGYSQETAIP